MERKEAKSQASVFAGMTIPEYDDYVRQFMETPARRRPPATKRTVCGLYFFKMSQAAHTTMSAVNSRFIKVSFHIIYIIEYMSIYLFYYISTKCAIIKMIY